MLGVPKLPNGTGEGIANAVYDLLVEWNLQDHVQAMGFDTTSANTGVHNGACTILERKLQRNLLYLACRHHISELILKSVFELKVCKVSSGPTVPLFVRFQKTWTKLNHQQFQSGMQDVIVNQLLTNDYDEIILFCLHEIGKPICRDDYKELLELTLVFLGHKVSTPIRPPGPVHHARWMAKALYVLKIYIFRDQFTLRRQEEKGMREMCVFLVKYYVKYWFKCPIAPEAPNNDLEFLKNIIGFIEVDKELSEAVIKKFSGHLWYLSDELIALSFFDKNISDEIKIKMTEKILSTTEI